MECEDGGFVDGEDVVLESGEGVGVLVGGESVEKEDGVGCRFDWVRV